VVFPKQKDPATPTTNPALGKLVEAYPIVLFTMAVTLALILARRNWKMGRTDRKGALRVAIASFLLFALGWIGDVHAVPTSDMAVLFYRAVSNWLMYASVVALTYLALEPAVRSRWPHSLVTWNRLLGGRWLDPQVASHVLIGSAIGCVVWLVFKLFSVSTEGSDSVDFLGNLWFTMGTRQWLSGYAYIAANAIRVGLFGFLAICGLRALVRNVWLASITASVLFTFTESSVVSVPNWQLRAAIYLIVYSIIAFVLLRFGLVATMSVVFFANGMGAINLGLDWKTWYAPFGLASLLLMIGILLTAFWRSLGSHGLFGQDTAENG
jgi:serine/threonine-protein kinase